MKKTNSLFIILVISIFTISCGSDTLPKPTGYFRIDLPEKVYTKIDSIPFPFSFELPQYGIVNLKRTKENPNFFNVDFGKFGARVHFSYLKVDTNIAQLLEESRSLAYKHTIKAQEINEILIRVPNKRLYGTLYSIKGNAASGSQFFLTDSTNHFLRGALYFNATPNADSLGPVENFIEKDINHFIESFEWKN